jgi:hypothetical protein
VTFLDELALTSLEQVELGNHAEEPAGVGSFDDGEGAQPALGHAVGHGS